MAVFMEWQRNTVPSVKSNERSTQQFQTVQYNNVATHWGGGGGQQENMMSASTAAVTLVGQARQMHVKLFRQRPIIQGTLDHFISPPFRCTKTILSFHLSDHTMQRKTVKSSILNRTKTERNVSYIVTYCS